MKICTKCKIEKHRGAFCRDKSKKDGLRSSCKLCAVAYKKHYYRVYKKNILQKQKLFYQLHKKAIGERHQQYYQGHKQATNKYKKEWYHIHRKQLLEQRKQYYKTNKEKILRQHKQHYRLKKTAIKKQHTQYRLTHKQKIAEYKKLYRQTPKGKEVHRNGQHKRRTLYKTTNITTNWLLAFRQKSTHCSICSIQMTDTPYFPNSKHLDHKIPLKVGGTHTKKNVRFICLACNLKRPKNGSDYIQPDLIPYYIKEGMMISV